MSQGLGPAMALVAILFAGCTGPIPGSPPEPTGQIDGAVVGPLLDPYAGLEVHLVELDRIDVTSELGGFTFRDVPVGVYTIEAIAEGTKGTFSIVTVEKDKITPTILQLFPLDPAPGFMEQLTNVGGSNPEYFAMPDSDCVGCNWTIPLETDPEEVVIRVSWEPFLGQTSPIRVDVYDADGTHLRTLEGQSPLRGSITGDHIDPGEEHLTLTVHFPEDFTPQPDFQFEAWAELYFGATRAKCLDQPTCADDA